MERPHAPLTRNSTTKQPQMPTGYDVRLRCARMGAAKLNPVFTLYVSGVILSFYPIEIMIDPAGTSGRC